MRKAKYRMLPVRHVSLIMTVFPRSLLRAAAWLSILAGNVCAAPPFTLSTQLVREGAAPGSRWTIPRVTAMGMREGQPQLLMTLSKLSTTGTDVYRGLGYATSTDGGTTWTPLVELPYIARPLRDGITGMFGAVLPVFHPQTGKVLLLGNCVGYTGYGTSSVKLTGLRYPAFAVYDVATAKWSADYTVLDDQQEANTTSGFPWILADGTLLWPCNGGQVLKASFDGEKVTILARSPQIEGLGKQAKNTGEYHLTKSGDKFYIAMRCPDQNRIAVSDDGQHFAPAVPLRWDDGTVVPSMATQMRWVRQQGRLYLVYTRVDPSSKGIFRNRAPLWMAELEPVTVRLKKSTEVIAVPISPGRDDLGNFGATFVSDELSLITTSEFGRTRGSNSRVYLTKVEKTP
ncbi:MAG: sialidase [Prosthecobacter sp.]|nr:sialidase [Prosthecobacter sp.]